MRGGPGGSAAPAPFAGQALWWVLIAVPVFAAAPIQPSAALLRDNSFCLGCHGPGTQAKGAVTIGVEQLRSSAHQSLTCADCHQTITTIPHGKPAGVDCGHCHRTGSPPMGLHPKALDIQLEDIHAASRWGRRSNVPTCVVCHGEHDIRPASQQHARTGRERILETCGGCHRDIAEAYSEGIHGAAGRAGNADVPTCTTCHREHRPWFEGGGLEGREVATCVSCHEDPGIQRRYALPSNRLASYLGTYHGTATKLGDNRTANCASCHGAHGILPSSDPRSDIHPANLPRTCGRCHPGVNENVARGKVHVEPTREGERLLFYINFGFRWFTFAIIGALMGHIGLELFGRVRGRRGGSQ